MSTNINKFNLFYKNLNTTIIFLALSWIIILFSINSGFYSIENIFIKDSLTNLLKEEYYDNLIINLLNSIRWILPILILPFLIKLSFKKVKYDFFSISLITLTLFYALLILFVDRPVTKFEVHGPQLIDNFNLLSCYLCTILIFSYLNERFKDKIIYFHYVLIVFIVFVVTFVFIQAIIDILKTNNIFLYYNSAFKPSTQYFDQPVPRITGWSRLVLILFILYFFFNEIKKINRKFYFINLLVLLFISFLIIFSQTRGSLIGFVFMFIFYLFLPKIKILKKAIIIFLFFSVPFISLNIIDEYTSKKNLRVDQNRYKITIEKLFNNNNKSTITDVKNIINDTSLESNNNSYSVSSGRIEIWKKSTDLIIKEKKILGFGPQGDRYVLTKLAENYLEASWSNNSSNAIIYSIVSGGIIGLILILLIYFSLFLIFLKSIKIIFINKVNDFTLISNFVVFCYLMMRSFFENSFAVFGVDFCIVITVYYIISSRIYYINKAL